MNLEDWHRRAREAEASLRLEDFWPAVLADQLLGQQVRIVLGMLAMIDKSQLRGACAHALQQISRLEAIGPLFDPTAWQDGRRFDNAGDVKKLLTLLIDLRDALPDRSNEP